MTKPQFVTVFSIAGSAALLYAAIGFFLWWLALRLPGNSVANLLVLGGLESVPEHLWGIYGLGILDRVPMLQGLPALPVLAFAIFEYGFYWSIVLGLACFVWRLWQWRSQANKQGISI